jgi:hypothetical protein
VRKQEEAAYITSLGSLTVAEEVSKLNSRFQYSFVPNALLWHFFLGLPFCLCWILRRCYLKLCVVFPSVLFSARTY